MEETLYLLLLVAKKTKKSVDVQNNKGKSPFFYARTPKMVLLLSLFSNLSLTDNQGETVLEACLRHNPQCAETLLSSGVTSNNKEFTDKELLFVYNLRFLAWDLGRS